MPTITSLSNIALACGIKIVDAISRDVGGDLMPIALALLEDCTTTTD